MEISTLLNTIYLYFTKVSLFLLLVLIISSCQKDSVDSELEKQELESNFKLGSPKDISNSPFPAGTQFYADVPYGQGARHKLDIFLPPLAKNPSGMVIYFHGGVFISGDKTQIYDSMGELLYIDSLLRKNIAFATVNYELIDQSDPNDAGVFQCFESGKRALQAIKYNQETLRINTDKIILYGSSAGSGIALWLGLSDDMAVPGGSGLSAISTSVKAIVVRKPQATYDFFQWKNKVFQNENLNLPTYDAFNIDSILQDASVLQSIGLFLGLQPPFNLGNINPAQLRQSVDLLNKIDSEDPALYIYNEEELLEPVIDANSGILTPIINHHPYHSAVLVKTGIEEGLEIEAQIVSLAGINPEYTSNFSLIEWIVDQLD